MKRYLFVYHYYSDGFVWVIVADNLYRAYRELKRQCKHYYIDREFLKVYDVDTLNSTQELN